MTDQSIIEELKGGNMKAFHYLYVHFPMVVKMVLKNNGTREDAKDLFQNALIVFYRKIKDPDFNLTSKISTYLYAICDKNWKKQLTRDKHRNHNNLDTIVEPATTSTIERELDEKTDQKPLKEYIKEMLQQLGDPCKSIILYHQFHKLSMEVIAEKMGYANAHTVRNQKYKCLQRLREMIPEQVKQHYLG